MYTLAHVCVCVCARAPRRTQTFAFAKTRVRVDIQELDVFTHKRHVFTHTRARDVVKHPGAHEWVCTHPVNVSATLLLLLAAAAVLLLLLLLRLRVGGRVR